MSVEAHVAEHATAWKPYHFGSSVLGLCVLRCFCFPPTEVSGLTSNTKKGSELFMTKSVIGKP